MKDSKRRFLSMSHGVHLSNIQCSSIAGEQKDMSNISYAFAIDFIMYAMIYTDVSQTLSIISKYQINSGKAH
jgi:hypothetical protein